VTDGVCLNSTGKDTSILSLSVKHRSLQPFDDLCVGSIDITLNQLLEMCESNPRQSSVLTFGHDCHINPAEAILELRLTESGSHKSDKGIITVQLSTIDPTQIGALAISNARQYIERGRIMKSAATAESEPVQATRNAAVVVSQPVDLAIAFSGVVSKLDLFIQIIDKASRVSMRRICMRVWLTSSVSLQVHPYANLAWQVTSSLYMVPLFSHLQSHYPTNKLRPSRTRSKEIETSLVL
jgi:hypothetical protein